MVPGAELAPPLPRWLHVAHALVIVACTFSGVVSYITDGVLAAVPAVCTILVLATYLRVRRLVWAHGYWIGHTAVLVRMAEALDRGMSADEWMTAEAERHGMSER